MKTLEAVNDFLTDCRCGNLSPHTIKQYQYVLDRYARHQPTLVDNPKPLRSYIVSLYESEFSEHTIYDHIKCLLRFYAWCAVEYSLTDVSKHIRKPKQPVATGKTISIDDFIKLFDSAYNVRDKLILAMMMDTGIRVSELSSLRVEHVISKRQAQIFGKGDKHRKVFWSEMTNDLLLAWLRVRNATHEYLLTSINDNSPLTEWGIRQLLKRMKKRLCIKGAVNPHAFRHGFIKHYIATGGDLVTLARLTGHSDINYMVSVYGQFRDDETALMYESHSPMKHILSSPRNTF